MNRRIIVILAALLVALAAMRFFQKSAHRSELQSDLNEQVLSCAAGEVGGITVTGPGGEQLLLEREGDLWLVANRWRHPANADKVNGLIEALSEVRGEPRPANEEVLPDFGLDAAQAISIEVTTRDGKVKPKLLVGKSAGGRQSSFIATEGADRVFASASNLLAKLGIWGEKREPSAKHFLELKPVSLDRDSVRRITVADGDARRDLTRQFGAADSLPVDAKQYEWLLNGEKVDRQYGENILGGVTSIHAREVLDPSADHGFDGSRQLEVHLADGSSVVLELGDDVDEPEKGVAMRVAGFPAVYLIAEYNRDRMLKQP